ncbi:MAG: ABC transporter ATP-binding protein [Sphaerobacteraceae bacterium]|nr:MAG: ABC transporter ATP-binding protein [Sphaerobacteraceae bacterium]
MTSPVLSIKDLHLSYGSGPKRVRAVRGVNFDINPGEVLGVVGESGCGKSTVAFAAMGYVAPGGQITQGEILYQGKNITTMRSSDLQRLRGNEIAMIFQNPLTSLNPSMTVGEQVIEVLEQHAGMRESEARQRAIDLFESVHLPSPSEVLDRYPHQLSGGQQQRVVIAMGMACDPALLIMDEPTTGLDVTTEATILDLVAELKEKTNAAILYITHNLGVIARVADRVVVMYSGEVAEEATVTELFERPRHPYTTGLMGAVPDVTRAGIELRPIPGQLPRPGSYDGGCAFAPRCSYARDVCHDEHPALDPVGESHFARCFFSEEVSLSREESSYVPEEEGAREDSAPVLQIKDLKKYYEQSLGILPWSSKKRVVKAVDGVSFEIGERETLALVGESGCGKTTLSSAIVGLLDDVDGGMLLNGDSLQPNVKRRSKDQRQELQIVFQNPDSSLNPAHTIFEIISRPLKLFRGEEVKGRVQEEVTSILESVNLHESYLWRHPSQLSGGEKQRVGIARALAANPKVIICDEPVSALDVSVQATVLNLLKRLQRDHGYSYLFISHDLSVVRYLSHRVVVMYLGHVMEVGPTNNVFEPPYHPYTEALTSAIPLPNPGIEQSQIRLEGSVPSAANPPSGCPFQTRCPRKIGSICEEEFPPLQDAGDGHLIRCHIPMEELRSVKPVIRLRDDREARAARPEPEPQSVTD